MEAENLKILTNALGSIEISKAELGTLTWIASFEKSSCQNIASLIEKAKELVKADVEKL
ncbi:MAG: hypothetical protein Q8N88_05670 [Nanoarchaeota archaeon]|nr:hypothetical protein [Nanoarchaeota archaeon]